MIGHSTHEHLKSCRIVNQDLIQIRLTSINTQHRLTYKWKLKTKPIAAVGFDYMHDIINCRDRNLLSFHQFGNHQESFEFYFDRVKHCSYNSVKIPTDWTSGRQNCKDLLTWNAFDQLIFWTRIPLEALSFQICYYLMSADKGSQWKDPRYWWFAPVVITHTTD